MKMNLLTLLSLLAISSLTSTKYSGYEENIKGLVFSVQFLSDNFIIAFEPINHYITNVENYDNNDMLFTDDFKQKLNEFISQMNAMKAVYYRNLKMSLKYLYYIKARELSFDLYLSDGYSDTIKFIGNFELEEMEVELRDLFKDFIGQKNYLFYCVRELYKHVKNLIINSINIYDTIETFHEYAKDKDDQSTEYTLDDIKRYYFILGFLRKLHKYYLFNRQIENSVMSGLEQWEQTLQMFDESLETINVYYHRRYTEGINTDSEDRDPIAVCNNMYLKNFWIKGEPKAEEIERFQEIKECPNIANSCCKRQEIRQLYKGYYADSINIGITKYTTLFNLFSYLLDNYSKYQRHAYEVMRYNAKTKGECYLKAKNLIFNPISKDFVNKFKQFADKTYEFAKVSRAGIYCALCDYDFHKTMMEDNSIKFSKDFCDVMVDKTFDYTVSYHFQLEEYFNDLIQVLQCDPKSGLFRKETDLSFKSNQEIREILINCDANKRENCTDYCSQFFYTRFNAIFDIKFEQIVDLYKFIVNRTRFYNIKMDGEVNEANFIKFNNSFGVDKAGASHQHIDDLIRKFVDDPEDTTAHNPYIEGPTEEDILRFQNEDQED